MTSTPKKTAKTAPSAQLPSALALWAHWLTPPGAESPLAHWQQRLLGWLERLYLFARALRGSITPPPWRAKDVRVIAIGNFIVGGAGKTPCALALAAGLAAHGARVGFVSRGYKSQAERQTPTLVMPSNLMNLKPEQVGDEAWLLAWRTERPVAVGKNRKRALQALLAADPSIDTVILDDGLSQRSLAWNQSLLLIDERGFGNGRCLPNGPLREPPVHLNRFTAWIDNGFSTSPIRTQTMAQITLPESGGAIAHAPEAWIPLASWRDKTQWLDPAVAIAKFRGKAILAIAGIAVPERFFQALRSTGLEIDTLACADHDPRLVSRVLHAWASKKYDVLLMTEKDAVKFFHHDSPVHAHAWALRLKSTLEPTLIQRLVHGLETA